MPDAKSNIAMAIESLNAQDFSQAEKLCREVLRDEPEHARAWHLCGVALVQRDEFETGTECFEKAVQFGADVATYHYNLGLAYRRLNRLTETIACYRRALELNPDLYEARNNLGNALIEMGNIDEAVSCYREIVAQHPDNSIGHFNLGNILQEAGEYDESISHLRRAIELDPDSVAARENLGRTYADLHDFPNALKVWDAWLDHDPDNAVAQHMAAAIRGDNAMARCTNDYIRGVFDKDFAATFDMQLARLDYHGPQLMAQALKQLDPQPEGADVLDAGCGTGLSAEILRPFSANLVGVDLSADMLQRARDRNLYDQLIEDEITHYLQQHPQSFDVVICSDTFCYFGDLSDVFAAVAGCLRKDGYFIFSLEHRTTEDEEQPESVGDDAADKAAEKADDEADEKTDDKTAEQEFQPYQVNPNGRYCHEESYVRDALAAAGLTISRLEYETLRIERSHKVPGLVVTAAHRAN